MLADSASARGKVKHETRKAACILVTAKTKNKYKKRIQNLKSFFSAGESRARLQNRMLEALVPRCSAHTYSHKDSFVQREASISSPLLHVDDCSSIRGGFENFLP